MLAEDWCTNLKSAEPRGVEPKGKTGSRLSRKQVTLTSRDRD